MAVLHFVHKVCLMLLFYFRRLCGLPRGRHLGTLYGRLAAAERARKSEENRLKWRYFEKHSVVDGVKSVSCAAICSTMRGIGAHESGTEPNSRFADGA